MNKRLSNVLTMALLTLGSLFTSCDKNGADNSEFVEDFVGETVFGMHRGGNCGKLGCFEFVFPLTVNLPGEDPVEVNDYKELRDVIHNWKEDNMESTERPTLAFPLEVVTQDGEVVSVANESELQALNAECRKTAYTRGHHREHRGEPDNCFSLEFPVTVKFPDGTTATADSKEALQDLVRTWKQANGPRSGRPELVFPIKVKMEDGTIKEVADKAALHALKESCSSN